jgi:hypothetical protein
MIRNILIILLAVICLDAMAYGPWIFGGNNTSIQVPFTQKAVIGTDNTSSSAMLTIAGQQGVTAPIANTNLHVSGANGNVNYVSLDSYGGNSVLLLRSSRGTQSSPTASISSADLGSLQFFGYGSTGYSASPRAEINARPTETWTDSAQGTSLRFQTTATGEITRAVRMFIDGAGALSIGNGATAANASSILDVVSTTKGFLPPRQTTVQKTAIASPATGLEVYDTTLGRKEVYNGSSWDAASVNIGHPSLRPSLILDFANSRTLDPRITFVRATNATRVNERGLIETVASGVPRFDHDPITGESLGLLIEEARTNVALRSEEFDNASWSRTNIAAPTANSTVSPDGQTTAETLTDTNDGVTNTTHAIFQSTNYSYTSGTSYTYSIFAKQGTVGGIQLIFGSLAFTSNIGARFNLVNGTVAASDTGVAAAIKAYPNDWYRVSITATATTTTAASSPQIRIATTTSAFYPGTGTGTIFVWGVQHEVGSFPTSYIPTVASSVTRNADQASMTGTNFSSWYRNDEGTIVLNTRLNGWLATPTPFNISDGTSSERIITQIGSGVFQPVVTDGGSTQWLGTLSAVSANTSYSVSMAYKLNDFAASMNGGAVIVDGAGTLPTVDRIHFYATGGGTVVGSAYVRQFYFYPKRLTNAELQAVTR